jgi:pyruvate dehydrogenase E1 component alpha subunit
VVIVVEDNDWGISVPRSQSTSVASNADRAAAYGMPGVRVEGNSVEAIYEAAGEAIARARSGGGPSLIEVHTLRLWGHFEGDAEGYRPDLDTVAEHDPIPIYRDQLLKTGALTDGQYEAMQSCAGERVEDAIDFAKSSPTPDPLGHLSYVFSEGANS